MTVKQYKRGLLLVNLGTPTSCERKSVGRFLRQFLSDPLVIDLPRWLWLPLLYLVIVPLRSGRSAKAYRKIWMAEGSPLLVYSNALARALQNRLGDSCLVKCAMRYGDPSIEDSLAEMKIADITELTLLPLFPQYSRTTTASVEKAFDTALAAIDDRSGWAPEVHKIHDYHVSPSWVRAVAASIRDLRSKSGKSDKLLFSMHGIPQRYVTNGDPYRDQCEASVEAIAAELGLDDSEWLLTYQSRVGREPWLQPYTDKTLMELASLGVRQVQVVCPAFAVDCLETLEEIAMENKQVFIDAGGDDLVYIPCLNDSAEHVEAMFDLLNS